MERKKSYHLQDLATLTGSQLIGNPQYQVEDVADIETATPQDVSFLSNPRYKQAMKNSQAGVICIDKHTTPLDNKNFLICLDPSRTFQQIVELFHPQRLYSSGFSGIHPTAVVHPSAQIGQEVTISPYAVIDENVVIGDKTFIGAGVYIGPETFIGQGSLIHARVVIRERCVIGQGVIIQPGAIIGSCGFGYTMDQQGRHTKLNQVGNVILEDEVEIGANTTIDRARFKSTRIGKGSKIDNLVQIAHGVVIGPHNIIVAQTGIAGSTTTGKYVVLGGQVGVGGHLYLGDGVMVAAQSGVTKSLSAGKYGGMPAIPLNTYNRIQVFLRHIETYVNQIKTQEERLLKLEQHESPQV